MKLQLKLGQLKLAPQKFSPLSKRRFSLDKLKKSCADKFGPPFSMLVSATIEGFKKGQKQLEGVQVLAPFYAVYQLATWQLATCNLQLVTSCCRLVGCSFELVPQKPL